MRSSRSLSALIIATTVLASTACQAQGLPGRDRIVLTEQDAVLLPVPELVSQGLVTAAEWSADGRYVLANRSLMRFAAPVTQPPHMEASLVLWSQATRRAQEVWKSKNTGDGAAQIAWMGRAPVALALLDIVSPPVAMKPQAPETILPQRWLFRVDARKGQGRPIARVEVDARVLPSPTQPLAVVLSLGERTLRLVGADGVPRPPVRLPDLLQGDPRWSDDGTKVAFAALNVQPKGVAGVIWYRFDPASGQIMAAPAKPASSETRPAELPVTLKHGSGAVKEAATAQSVRPLWLEGDLKSESPRALIAADSDWGRFSPAGDAVLYVSEGAAWVLPLVRVPKEVFQAMRAAARRSQLLSNGKQLGVALIMYAQDYDEKLPAAGEPVNDMLMPYLKTDRLFDGFVYTFPGGSLGDIQDPAGTLLGYVSGPGGRANIYADGHVKWEADGG